MTNLNLDLKKNLEQNAESYFNKAKKQKQKLKGAEAALKRSEEKFLKLQKEELKEEKKKKEEEEEKKNKRKLEWYEKFRWFMSSEVFLCIGGRDATSNEIIIKKHMEKNDLVCHTDMAGSPFFIIKDGQKAGKETIQETIDATFTYSRAWKLGLATASVFYVKPEQVSKKTQSGEYMPKGAFMIRGKTNYIQPKISLAVGVTKKNILMGGPLSAIKKNCEKYLEIEPGNEKTSAVAKKIQKKISGTLDEIIRVIPAGGCKIKK